MKFICEIVRYNDLPRRQRKSDDPVVGCMLAVCDESQVSKAIGSPQGQQLVDVYPRYLIFDFSEDEPPRLHEGFSNPRLNRGMWTVESKSVFNTFDQALKKLKSNWDDIQKGMKILGGFTLELNEILKPESEDMQKVMRDIFE